VKIIGRLFTLLLFLLFTAAMPCTSFGQSDWKTFRNTEFKFRFIYPSDWMVRTPRGQNVRGSIISPKNTPHANFNIVVKHKAELSTMTKKELKKEIEADVLAPKDWRDLLEEKFPDVRIYGTKKIKIDNWPGYFSIYESSYEAMQLKIYVKGINYITFTPGFFWHLGCGGTGRTPKEAHNSYEYWQPTMNRIFSSFVFE